MNPLRRYAVLGFAGFLGCSSPTGGGPAGGGKADDAAATAAITCLVAQVLEDDVLEEGLTSAFDIDRMGALDGDADGTTVRIDLKKGEARLGQHAFRRADGDEIAAEEAAGDATNAHRRVRVTSGDRTFELRLFSGSGLATLTVEEDGAGAKHFATLDCRPAAEAPNDDDAEPAANCAGSRFESGHCRHDNGQFAAASCCKPSCDVVLLDDGEFEEGLGSMYDIDVDGFLQTDEDATTVRSDLADEADGWSVGNQRFAPGDGDTVSRQPGLESLFQRWSIESQVGVSLEIRIFDVSRLGVVMAKTEGDAELHMMARLDCRDLPRPAILE